MSDHFLTQSLLLFLLVCAEFTCSKVHYITPSLDSPCPQYISSCLTLSQFATNYSHNETDISLLFLQGNHIFDQELFLVHGHNFSIGKYAKHNETVFVECTNHLGRFDIKDTTYASIKDINFIGCGNNSVSQVTWLTIADSTFQGVRNKSTVLLINEVDTANIVKSQFLYNTCEKDSDLILFYMLDYDLNYIYQQNTSSGVILIAFSNVSIISCRFMQNNIIADIGGTLVAYKSSIHTDKSVYSYNIATFGGAMVTSGSIINIDNSKFTHNSAQDSGGVMVTHNDRVNINNTVFSTNFADRVGGVMFTPGDSSFIVHNSNFTSNNAIWGGVMGTSGDSSFTFSSCNFTSNSAAARGGVMDTSGVSLFTLKNSKFTSNSAIWGGVVATFGNCLFTINNSNFTSNSATEGGVIDTSGDSLFTINDSNFTSNGAKQFDINNISNSSSIPDSIYAHSSGGVIFISGNSSFTISNNNFTFNNASEGGVIANDGTASFTISNSYFTSNSALILGGGVMTISGNSSFTISNCNFTSNSAFGGGVIYTSGNSSFSICNSNFTSNSATVWGGVMFAYGVSSFAINNSNFTLNSAFRGGVVGTSGDSSFAITKSTFTSKSGKFHSAILELDNNSFILEIDFDYARYGGVIYASGKCIFTISSSNFTSNYATWGGVIYTNISGDSTFTIRNSRFLSNTADIGGVVSTTGRPSFTITNSIFTSNSATENGGVIDSSTSFTISNSNFTSNSAVDGGVIKTSGASLTISNSTFHNNSATSMGGVIDCAIGTLNIDNSTFSSNSINTLGGGIIFISQSFINIANSAFNDNVGSIYTFNSNLTFSGNSKFENSTELFITGNESTMSSQEGGVITSFQSTVIFTTEGHTYFSNNQARDGGAILAIESTIIMYGETEIVNNNNNIITTMIANSIGGGISLSQTHLEIKGKCNLVNNSAVRGGGIHATSSTIAAYQPGILQIINNNAEFGGGMYLEANSKLYVLKIVLPNIRVNTFAVIFSTSESSINISTALYFLNFTGNIAKYGGALYVADVTNSGTCLPQNECFIQTLALYPKRKSTLINTVNILFSENTATAQGSNLFGGLLDRCIPTPFAEVYRKQTKMYYSGASYFQYISKITQNHSISSHPVRVCFCNTIHEPDCSYQLPTITVKKGETFNVSVVAVDQVNNTVDANIITTISSSEGGFSEGQQTQSVGRNCTDLTYNVFSPFEYERLHLFADGPCGSAALSTSHVIIQFTDCICPVGFQPLSNSKSSTKCECICDSKLYPYITDCNDSINSVSRLGTNSWITYINDTNSPGYVKYPNCPYDYCQPPTKNVSINFNLHDGADTQCAYNRTGVLCGSCSGKFSLSIASSRCFPCYHHWPAVCVVILLAAILAGIVLVSALLALKMTVSVGLINGFIFYVNIVSAGSAVFFPSSEPSLPSVFVAWLNLDIGIDVCFIDGLDSYIKTWLQLAFPVYIISLVVLVIKISEYSPRFVRFTGRRDPVSTLATLILLSYAKLLSVTITALSFAKLDYPDGKQEIVWLPDGNVKYFRGKHIPLVLAAVLIILIGLPYTILLLLWQWIVRASNLKIFNWTRDTKLNAFIATYHVPHNSEYRYWTGLLLLVRAVLYVTASITVSANPQTLPLIAGVLIGGLFLFKGLFALRVYKNSLVDVVNTMLYFNLLALAVLSLYNFKIDPTKQTAVAYTSTIVTIILFIGSICYHVSLLIKKSKPPHELNKYPINPVLLANTGVSYSVTDTTERNQDPPKDRDRDEQSVSKDDDIDTPLYIN